MGSTPKPPEGVFNTATLVLKSSLQGGFRRVAGGRKGNFLSYVICGLDPPNLPKGRLKYKFGGCLSPPFREDLGG
jgi:hypothetical protein